MAKQKIDPMQAWFEGADEEQLRGAAPGTAMRAFAAAGGSRPVNSVLAAFDAAAPGQRIDTALQAADVLSAFDAAAPGGKMDAAFTAADRINQAMAGTGGTPPVTTTDGDDPPLPTPASTTTTTPTTDTTATPTPTVDEGALLNEVMGAIRSNPEAFSSGVGIHNFRLSGGQRLVELPQAVQDQMNAFLDSSEYMALLGAARDRDPAIQAQRVRDEQAAREAAARQEAEARAAREAAAAQALATQQAATPVQASAAPIEVAAAPVASDVTNAATFAEGVPLQAEAVTAPSANPNTGLNNAIVSRLGDTAALDLPSNDELRRNQIALLADIQNQAEAAGKSAVEGLTLPDLTAVSVPPRQLSPMEQALETRLTDRLTGGRFLDPQSALTNEAEAQALARLQRDSFLGGSAGLDAAERRAMARLTDPALLGDPNSDLITGAEDVIAQRLLGGESPAMAAQRARVEERYGQSMEEGRELLNRLGVLRGGDTADIFNELTRGRDQQMLDVDALGYDLQTQALQDALGFQGRRDALAQAEQALQRGAISDVAGLAGQRDERAMAEEALRRQAIGDTLPFQQRRDALSMAEQDLQRAAISDAMTRQGMVDQRDLAEAELSGSLRGAATLPARMAQAGLQFDAANLQQDVADRTLARLLTQTEPTQRERFEEGVRGIREQERLAALADQRQTQALESQLFGEVAGGGSAPPRTTLAGRGFEQDILSQQLQRQLARSADLRAAQAQEAELFGEVAGGGSAPARQTRQAEMDAFNQALARAGLTGMFEGEDTMARQQLQDQLLSSGLERQFASAADRRASQALASDLLTAQQQRGLAQTADERAAQVLQDQLLSSGLERQFATAADRRASQALGSDLLTAQQQRRLAGTADERAAQALASDLETAEEQRLSAALERQFASAADRRASQALASDLLTAQQQRGLAQTADERAAQILQDQLLSSGLERQFATAADRRASQALSSDLLTAQQQRGLAQTADERAGRGFEDDLLTAALNRRLAQTGDERAAQILQDQLLSAALERQFASAADRRASQALASDLLTAQDQRELAQAAGIRAERGFEDDLLSAALNRRLAQAGDLRAGQAQDAALFGEVAGPGSAPPRQTMAREALDLSQRDQLISQILAAADPTQSGRLDPLAAALVGEAGFEDPIVQALSDAFGLSEMPSMPDGISQADKTQWNQAVDRIRDPGRSANDKQANWRLLRQLEAKYNRLLEEEPPPEDPTDPELIDDN